MTAFELCGIYDGQNFKVKNGKVIWECITYMGNDKCLLTRFSEEGKGAKSIMGLRIMKQYIDPETEIIIQP